ncbi:g009 [Yersinia phage phiR1-37]|uniref:hypothetical protein n=1 Tax=Yersinia phage phiR1-37 TaxID=331278 RepID=UPI00022DBCB5|nr:hypothetical protein phiR1-37_gp009 [Yersinia phage phiR1-37]CCE26033.1 g009 [Yersinia phage phiR1-37]
MLIVKAKRTSLAGSKQRSRPSKYYLLTKPRSALNSIKNEFDLGTYEMDADYSTMYSYTHQAVPIYPIIMELKNVANPFSRCY